MPEDLTPRLSAIKQFLQREDDELLGVSTEQDDTEASALAWGFSTAMRASVSPHCRSDVSTYAREIITAFPGMDATLLKAQLLLAFQHGWLSISPDMAEMLARGQVFRILLPLPCVPFSYDEIAVADAWNTLYMEFRQEEIPWYAWPARDAVTGAFANAS